MTIHGKTFTAAASFTNERIWLVTIHHMQLGKELQKPQRALPYTVTVTKWSVILLEQSAGQIVIIFIKSGVVLWYYILMQCMQYNEFYH